MKRECPICGRPLTVLDIVLADSGVAHQCHHCWSRVNATGPTGNEAHGARPGLLTPRRATQTKRRKR